MKKIVYTCITGGYDQLRDPEVASPGWKFIAFTDTPIESAIWEQRPLASPEGLSAVKQARWHKTHARELFGKDALVIWHDGNLTLKFDPDYLVGKFLPRGVHLASYQHPQRDCVYDEANAIISLKKDTAESVGAAVECLVKMGMPVKYGLTETGIMIQRTSDKVSEFMNMWWSYIEQFSHRDQLFFDFTRWATGMQVQWISPREGLYSKTKHPKKVTQSPEKPGYDVVYVLGRGSRWENNEIRFSIRSVKKYFKDLRQVVIVGEKPAWATNILHIEHSDNYVLTKDQIITEKLLAACSDPRVSSRFLFACDDKALLRPCRYADFDGWHTGEISPVEAPDSWRKGLVNTREYLVGIGAPTNDYNSPHAFQPVDKRDFTKIMGATPWKDEDIYAPSAYLNRQTIFPGSHVNGRHALIRGSQEYLQILDLIDGRISMNYNNGSLNDALRDTLAVLFPDQCDCEIYGLDGSAWTEYQAWIAKGKPYDQGVDMIRRHTRNINLVRHLEKKKENPKSQKVLERNLLIISKKWKHSTIG